MIVIASNFIEEVRLETGFEEVKLKGWMNMLGRKDNLPQAPEVEPGV